MRITVQYMTQIKRAAGCSSEPFDAREGADLREALQSLADCHGAAFRAMLLDESSEPRRTLLYFVGDEHADFARRLREGDTVTILAPMAGG